MGTWLRHPKHVWVLRRSEHIEVSHSGYLEGTRAALNAHVAYVRERLSTKRLRVMPRAGADDAATAAKGPQMNSHVRIRRF